MLSALVRGLAGFLPYVARAEMKYWHKRGWRRLQHIAIAAFCFSLAALLLAFVLFGLMASLFFYLADLANLLMPALVVIGLAVLIAILLFWQGIRLIKS